VAVAVGFVAAAAQVVLLREVLVAAGGNELVAGLGLCCWLLGTAAGSAGAGLLVDRRGDGPWPARVCAVALVALGVSLPLAVWSLGAVRGLVGPPAGELMALHQALAICLATFVPTGMAVGATFPALTRLAARAGSARRAAARVLALESAGFAAAGLLFGLWAVTWLPPGVPSLYGERSVARIDSVYGRIEVLEGAGQHDVVIDGVWAFSHPDPESAERAVHPAMLHHPAPVRVLLVGGVASGALAEVLKHPTVTRVDAVELDPALIEVTRRHLPPAASVALDDPRVSLQLSDGRAFVRDGAGSYDVVLLVMPDPSNAQLNRYYTVEWFARLRERLAEGGLVAVGVSGSATMLGPAQARYVAAIRRTLAEVFPAVGALPGEKILLLGSDAPERVTVAPAVLAERMVERELPTRYVDPFGLEFELGPLRVDYLQQVLADAGEGPPNRDLVPLCYYLDTVLWATAQSPRWREVVAGLEGLWAGWLALAVLAGALIHTAAIRVRPLARGARRASVPAAVAVVGATGIVGELALILAYQVAFGNLYARIGLMVAAYMVGLAAGGWWMARRPARTPATLALLQLTMAAACGLLWLGTARGGVAWWPPGLELAFPALVAGLGLVAGLHFPAAVAALGGATGDRRTTTGVGGLYAADLAGAAVAALAASTVAIPVLGVPAVLGLLALANVGATIVLVAAGARPPVVCSAQRDTR
jgi:spermidine synthase